METKIAVTLGLLINEIATNAIKHGFTEDMDAEFSVSLQEDKSENQYVLTLTNTGRPFPNDIELDKPGTLGLELVSALVSQLDGSIDLRRESHPVFTIRFPVKE